MNHVAKRLIDAARKLLDEELTLFETEPRTAKKRTPKKPCPSCGKRVPLHQVPPFEGHKPGCATVLHWNSKLPPKNVEGARVARDVRYAEEAEKAKMEFVVDALGSWSDDEIDQHLQGLKSQLKNEDAELELRCWSKALAEFGDYLKSAAAPEIQLYVKQGGRWALALVYKRDETQFGLDKMNAQEVADWVAELRGPGYKVVVDNQTFITSAGGAKKIKA